MTALSFPPPSRSSKYSMVFLSRNATRSSGPTPSAASALATWFERASSSPHVSVRSRPLGAMDASELGDGVDGCHAIPPWTNRTGMFARGLTLVSGVRLLCLPMTKVEGYVEPGFEGVRDAFATNFEQHGEVGAGFALH